ncbi:hypothetical protein HNP65_000826 [Thermosipho japonicus]|uniref:Uncharacterized protein n=1 Tax=Thermosipho japonicus TaxID=90323 RepID=A0A841GS49_9BACT|nr:hypothetical protein [Thermosipho japonicus]MBB6062388.1 hypothetical protein [Thermosipho japonicus]
MKKKILSITSFAKFWGIQVINNDWYLNFTSRKYIDSFFNNTNSTLYLTKNIFESSKVIINSQFGIK